MSAIVRVFYYTGPFTGALLPGSDALRARLNPARRERLEKRSTDSQRAVDLAALRILELGMAVCGQGSFALADVLYRANAGVTEKPVWEKGQVDFSISHSRSIAMVAIATQGRVGVDVEDRRAIEPRVVRRLLRDDADIALGLDESNAIARWTQIEAVLKGAGLGIMHGREIEWQPQNVRLRGQQWHLLPVDCGPDHVAHVAMEASSADVKTIKIEIL